VDKQGDTSHQALKRANRAIETRKRWFPQSTVPRQNKRDGDASRRWGVGIKERDESVVIERDPWEG
jgi:hypothetical protein